MPKLGALWYDLFLNDLTDTDIKKIQDKLKNLNSTLKLDIDTTSFDRRMADIRRRTSSGNSFRVGVGVDVSQINSALNSIDSGLSGLQSKIEAVFGGYLVQNFLRNLVDIGGEFEYQQKAIESILGSESKSEEIFTRIQRLAVKSPFGAMDLTKYAKQLTAYSIPYNELYETLKNIADISVGVGVDMGRIILAYGQVRSAGFLRGTEARQFAEANIPVIQALAEKYSELEGRLVSVGEVYDRMSKREIPFEDLQDVLMAMAEDGGKFADMQEKLSDTTKAVWKNFSDAIYQMYYEIGEANSGIIKGTGLLLTEIAQNWKTIAPLAVSLASGYGMMRLASAAYQTVAGKELSMTMRQIMADRERNVSQLEQASQYRDLTRTEQRYLSIQEAGIRSTRRLSAQYLALQMNMGRLGKEDLLKGLHYGTFTREQGMALASMQNIALTADEVNRAIGGTSRVTQSLSRRFPTLAQGFNLVGRAARNAGRAITNFVRANWIVLAISLIVEGIMAWVNANKELEESIKRANQAAKDTYKALSEEMERLKGMDFQAPGMDTSTLKQSIKEMDTLIRDNVQGWQDVLSRAYYTEEGVSRSLEETAQSLKQSISDITEANRLISEHPEIFSLAMKATDGYFDEPLTDNIHDAVEAYQEFNEKLMELASNGEKASKVIQAMGSTGHKSVMDFVNSLDPALSNLEKLTLIAERFPEQFSSYAFNYADGFDGTFASDYKSDLNTMKADLRTFLQGLRVLWKQHNIDLTKDSGTTRAIILSHIGQILPEFEGMADSIRNSIIERAIRGEFNIPITLSFEGGIKDLTAGWQDEMIAALQSADTTNSPLVSAIKEAKGYADAVDGIRSAYKSASEELDILGKKLQAYDLSGSQQIAQTSSNAALGGPTRELLQQALRARRSIEEAERAARYGNFSLGNDDTTKKRRTIPTSSRDEMAEIWKKRLNLIEQADKAYRRWLQLLDSEQAAQKLRESGIYVELGADFDFSKAREAYRKYLDSLTPKTEKQRETVKSGMSIMLEWDEETLRENMEKAVRSLEDYIEANAGRWDLFGKIFELTGDQTYAYTQAFETLNEVWSKESEQLRDTFGKMLSGAGIDLSLDEFNFHENESEMEALLGKDSALMKMWSEIKKRIEEDGVDLKIRTAEAISEMMTARDKVEKIRAQMEEDLSQAPDDTSREALRKQWEKQLSDAEFEVFKQDTGWERIFGDLDRVSLSTIENMIRLVEQYAKQTGLSVEATKELQQALENLRQKRMEIVSPITSFMESRTTLNRWKTLLKQMGDRQSVTVGEGSGQRTYTRQEVYDGIQSAMTDMNRSVERGIGLLQSVNSGISLIGGLLSSMGADWLSDVSGIANNALSGASNMSQSLTGLGELLGAGSQTLKSLGYAGMAAGAAIGIAQGIVQLHDGRLQKMIEESQRRVRLMQQIQDAIDREIARTLGDGSQLITDDMQAEFDALSRIESAYERLRSGGPVRLVDLEALRTSTGEYEKLLRLREAYDKQGTYGYDLQLLKEQEAELEYQRQKEWEKTNTDYDQLQSYDEQLSEIRDQIKYYWQDLGEELYGIDFKDWASQLTDAIREAVRNGEDVWLAYEKTVGDIIKDLAAKWAATNIMQPAMESLMNTVFGEGGYFQNDGRLDSDEIRKIGEQLKGVEFSSAVDSIAALFEALDAAFKDSEDAGGGSLSKIGDELTEETGSLLASYVNAIRADVSVLRMLQEQLGGNTLPGLNITAQSQLTELRKIEENTARNAEYAEEISRTLRSVTGGTKRIHIA